MRNPVTLPGEDAALIAALPERNPTGVSLFPLLRSADEPNLTTQNHHGSATLSSHTRV